MTRKAGGLREGPTGFLLERDEVGQLRQSERQWPAVWQVGIGALTAVFFALVVTAIDGIEDGAWMLFSALVVVATVLGFTSLVRHRLHDRGIVTGKTLPGTRTYIVPWATIDAERIRLHHNGYAIERRLPHWFLRIADRSWRLEQIGLNYRYAISFRGLHFDLADVRQRRVQMSHGGLRGAAGRAALEERIYWRNPYADPPFPTATWILSVRRPKEFLEAMEEAMVASGREEARGLAERVLANPVRERWRNPLTDEEIYGTAEKDPTEGPTA